MSIISRGKEIASMATGANGHQKNPDDYLLALDIGTEYVKALIAKKGKGALKIVGVGKAHEAPTNMYSGAIADIEGVAQTCEEALSRAEEMAGVRAQEVVIGIAGELIKGNTASIKYRRADASRPITDAEMEKIINMMPQDQKVKAKVILEINNNHEIATKLKAIYKDDKEQVKEYAKILFAQARLIEGLTIENPTEISNMICKLLAK